MSVRIVMGILIFFLSFSIKLKAQPPVNQLINQIKNELNFTEAEAHAFLANVTERVRKLQIFLNILSSTENSQESKEVVVNFLLNEIFTKDAFVTVSSKNNNGTLEKLPIEQYLIRLVNQSKDKSHTKTQIFFNPRYLKISDFEKNIKSGNHQMLVQVEQYFQGEKKDVKEEGGEITRNTIMGHVKELKDGTFQLKWHSIQVDETLRVSEKEIDDMLFDFEAFRTRYLRKLNSKD